MVWTSMWGLLRRAALIGLVLSLGAGASAAGENGVEFGAPQGPLDGKRFVGTFGPDGQPGDRQETLYFGEGRFWSEICVPCGFAPAVYWVRRVGDAIHFRGEMESAERGRFYYTGVVQDARLIAKINWRKERWYWSIDRDFKFEGTLSHVPVTDSAASVAHRAVSGETVCHSRL